MAKKVSKQTKKDKSKESVKVEEPAPQAPPAPIDPDMINVAFSKEEIDTFTNLLSLFAQSFQQLALSAAESNDDKNFGILSARHKLFTMLAGKLAMSSKIGEPTSRDIH